MTKALLAAVACAVLLAGCQTQHALRYEGVTPGAGNAIAANTVMQMVDPWPAGVEDTRLATPADRDQYTRQAAAEPAGESDSGVASTN